jgi:hypothetical protein
MHRGARRLSERLRGHVAPVRAWGLDAADLGVMAARDTGEPSVLASRIGVLASFLKSPPVLAMHTDGAAWVRRCVSFHTCKGVDHRAG